MLIKALGNNVNWEFYNYLQYLKTKQAIEESNTTLIPEEFANRQINRVELRPRCLLGDGSSTINLSSNISGTLTLYGWTSDGTTWSYGAITTGLSGTTLTLQSSTYYKTIERYDDGVLVDTCVCEECEAGGSVDKIYSNTGEEFTITTGDPTAVRVEQSDAPLLSDSGDMVGWGYAKSIDMVQSLIDYFDGVSYDTYGMLRALPFIPVTTLSAGTRLYTTNNLGGFRIQHRAATAEGDTSQAHVVDGKEPGFYEDSNGIYCWVVSDFSENKSSSIEIESFAGDTVSNGQYTFYYKTNNPIRILVQSQVFENLTVGLYNDFDNVTDDPDGVLAAARDSSNRPTLQGVYDFYNNINANSTAKTTWNNLYVEYTNKTINQLYADTISPTRLDICSRLQFEQVITVDDTNRNIITFISDSGFVHNLDVSIANGQRSSGLLGVPLTPINLIRINTNPSDNTIANGGDGSSDTKLQFYFGNLRNQTQIPKDKDTNTDINGEALIYSGRKDQPLRVGGVAVNLDTTRNKEIQCSQSLTGVTVTAVYGEVGTTGEQIQISDIGIDTVNDKLYNANAGGYDIKLHGVVLSDGTLLWFTNNTTDDSVIMTDISSNVNHATIVFDVADYVTSQKYFNISVLNGFTKQADGSTIEYVPNKSDGSTITHSGFTISDTYPSGVYLHELFKQYVQLPPFKTLEYAYQSNQEYWRDRTDSQGNAVLDRHLVFLSLEHSDKGFPAFIYKVGSEWDLGTYINSRTITEVKGSNNVPSDFTISANKITAAADVSFAALLLDNGDKLVYTGNNSYLLQNTSGANHGTLTTADVTLNQGVQDVFDVFENGFNDAISFNGVDEFITTSTFTVFANDGEYIEFAFATYDNTTSTRPYLLTGNSPYLPYTLEFGNDTPYIRMQLGGGNTWSSNAIQTSGFAVEDIAIFRITRVNSTTLNVYLKHKDGSEFNDDYIKTTGADDFNVRPFRFNNFFYYPNTSRYEYGSFIYFEHNGTKYTEDNLPITSSNYSKFKIASKEPYDGTDIFGNTLTTPRSTAVTKALKYTI